MGGSVNLYLIKVAIKKIPTKLTRKYLCVTSIFIIITIHTLYIIQAAKPERNYHEDGFYLYVLKNGISIKQISAKAYRISYSNWSCDIDTSIPKHFKKMNISWTDIFETSINLLSKETIFSPAQLRRKMGVLPEDGSPVTIVARQGNVSIPEKNVIIRLNRHGPLDARTTMIMSWPRPVKTVISSAREQPNDEIIYWVHHRAMGKDKNRGLWNTSQPLVIPEQLWHHENLSYYRGPLYFMKGKYFVGNFTNCNNFNNFIGLGALNRIIHVKGTVTTLGFSTNKDRYNTVSNKRFQNLAHKLAWSYYVVKELMDTS